MFIDLKLLLTGYEITVDRKINGEHLRNLIYLSTNKLILYRQK